VYCVSKAVGQTNTVPPPPPNKISPVRPSGSLSPTSGNIGFYCRNKICFQEAKIIKYFLPNSETFDETLRRLPTLNNMTYRNIGNTNNMTNIFDFAQQCFPVCPGH
jgi:hypothetical protein